MSTPLGKPTKTATCKRKSNFIRKAMEAKGMRPDEVAVAARCGVATIYRILRTGTLPATRNTRSAVCAALGIKDAQK